MIQERITRTPEQNRYRKPHIRIYPGSGQWYVSYIRAVRHLWATPPQYRIMLTKAEAFARKLNKDRDESKSK